MASKLDIVNEALVRIGAAPLGGLGDANAQAFAVEQVYDQTVRDLVTRHPWTFALRQKKLNSIIVAEVDRRWSDYDNVYQVPSNALRVFGSRYEQRYQLSGDQIYTDASEFELVYCAETPESAWPSYFVELVVLHFAAAVAISITDDTSRAQYFTDLARRQAGHAMSVDAQSVPSYVFDLMRIYTRGTRNPLAGA